MCSCFCKELPRNDVFCELYTENKEGGKSLCWQNPTMLDKKAMWKKKKKKKDRKAKGNRWLVPGLPRTFWSLENMHSPAWLSVSVSSTEWFLVFPTASFCCLQITCSLLISSVPWGWALPFDSPPFLFLEIFLVCRCQVLIDDCPLHALTFPSVPALHQKSQHFSNVLLYGWKCCRFCVIYLQYWWIQMLKTIMSKGMVFLSSPIFLLHHWKLVQHLEKKKSFLFTLVGVPMSSLGCS